MRLNCGPTIEERIAAKERWHLWFAWYPVRVAPHDCRWLERVERKGELFAGCGHTFWFWEYRAKQQMEQAA